jgi:transposase InsO family protein
MAELPKARLTPYEPAFSYTGVDYFGQFYVKRGRGKTTEKRWGVIFTCMNSRAVHLDVARSLETDAFILVLIRFLNRRGHVKEIRSDNGTNFVGAERDIQDAIKQLDKTKLTSELAIRGCNWVFHPPGASHMSGVWERLVRTVKRSLKAIVGKDLVICLKFR